MTDWKVCPTLIELRLWNAVASAGFVRTACGSRWLNQRYQSKSDRIDQPPATAGGSDNSWRQSKAPAPLRSAGALHTEPGTDPLPRAVPTPFLPRYRTESFHYVRIKMSARRPC